jgi:hypothetical protein
LYLFPKAENLTFYLLLKLSFTVSHPHCPPHQPQRARVLLLFYAVSMFNGKGKRSAFEAWEAFPDLIVSAKDGMHGYNRGVSNLATGSA